MNKLKALFQKLYWRIRPSKMPKYMRDGFTLADYDDIPIIIDTNIAEDTNGRLYLIGADFLQSTCSHNWRYYKSKSGTWKIKVCLDCKKQHNEYDDCPCCYPDGRDTTYNFFTSKHDPITRETIDKLIQNQETWEGLHE